MAGLGKGKKLISVSMPSDWERDIKHRADALGLTVASYTRLILKKWREDGLPPVSEPDKLMQVAKGKR
ncbi:MAG TPA: hypothetical protein VK737_05240 [Opitutales bacterium]|jgi:hypothetical protein|nr:hypothetical protein [Opitutales bacterium]